jgi:hypothetical protein
MQNPHVFEIATDESLLSYLFCAKRLTKVFYSSVDLIVGMDDSDECFGGDIDAFDDLGDEFAAAIQEAVDEALADPVKLAALQAAAGSNDYCYFALVHFNACLPNYRSRR